MVRYYDDCAALTARRTRRLEWLLLLLRAWDEVEPPELYSFEDAPSDEVDEMAEVFSGKRWDRVPVSLLRPDFAGLSVMTPPQYAYYLATFLQKGVSELLNASSGREHLDLGIDFVLAAGRTCRRLDHGGSLDFLTPRQCAVIYECLCWLTPMVPQLKSARLRWYYRVIKPSGLRRLKSN